MSTSSEILEIPVFPRQAGLVPSLLRALAVAGVITFMIGGTALCVTSLILAWRVLGRKLDSSLTRATPRQSMLSEDLAED